MGPFNERVRYNAKARQSTAGPSKRRRTESNKDVHDSNAEIVVPRSQEQKDEERKRKLREELEQQSETKWSGKKKKRMEKYIEKKLKKDERFQLLKKLAQSQAQTSTTLLLQPSSTLGSQRELTNDQLISRQEDKEVRRAMDGRTGGKRKRNRSNVVGTSDHGSADGSESSDADLDEPDFDDTDFAKGSDYAGNEAIDDEEPNTPMAVSHSDTVAGYSGVHQSSQTIGGALRKNVDGSAVAPTVIKREPKGKRTTLPRWGGVRAKVVAKELQKEDNESSFDSSDSELDADKEVDNVDKDEAGSDGGDDDDEEDDEEQNEDEGEDDDEEGEDDDEEEEDVDTKPTKAKGFKAWAMNQLSAAKPYMAPTASDTPPEDAMSVDAPPPTVKPPTSSRTPYSGPKRLQGPLGEALLVPSGPLAAQLLQERPPYDSKTPSQTQTKRVLVTRPPDIQESRLSLPIVAEEQAIVEAVLLNPVVILCGETGSGKTTQVPQFLYEAGFGLPDSDNPGMIGITQPRRVAAMSMASRVAHELSLPDSRVSFQVRYDTTVASTTAIKFMTDGVLLRELASDFLLNKYSVIIIDEAHERSVNTDILIGVLSRVVKLRQEMWQEKKDGVKPLRLIIMSATLRVEEFVENKVLFQTPPPVINVAARQHPVSTHFNRRTTSDYITEAVNKAIKIHKRLPPGGILIFLTGQNEIIGACKKLEARFGVEALQRKRIWGGSSTGLSKTSKRSEVKPAEKTQALNMTLADVEVEDMDFGDAEISPPTGDEVSTGPPAEGDLDEAEEDAPLESDESDVPMHILPLYSLLPVESQMKVFQPPPPGTRLVVVSTNVAETSITIPNIRYVVDCGRAKERRYDPSTGIQSFHISWISKASAAQRAGRAGRTGPGHCYRLYSSAVFERFFEKFSQPELLRTPIEGVVLQMKSMNIDTVINFPFPSPPDRLSIKKAEVLLTQIGALTKSTTWSTSVGHPTASDGQITKVGRSMALFPLSPRFARMVVSGHQHNCLPYVVIIVAVLSVGDPFIHEEHIGEADLTSKESDVNSEDEAKTSQRRAFFKAKEIHSKLGKGESDLFRYLSVVGAYECAKNQSRFCNEHFVRPKAMDEIHKLRLQLINIIQTNFPSMGSSVTEDLQPPNETQLKVLRQLLCAAFIDQVAIRKDLAVKSLSGKKYSTSRGVAYQALGTQEDVFIHPSSSLFDKSPPEYIAFIEIMWTKQLWLKNTTVINPAWLSSLGKTTMCTFSKPLRNKSGEMIVIPRFGTNGWELPPIKANEVPK